MENHPVISRHTVYIRVFITIAQRTLASNVATSSQSKALFLIVSRVELAISFKGGV